MYYFLLLCFLALPAFAVDDKPPTIELGPEVPEPPKQVQNGEEMEPDITIIRKKKSIIQEYRQGGKLYKVKVIPDVGPPYYFIDTDGDGTMETRSNDLDKGARVNMWKLLEW